MSKLPSINKISKEALKDAPSWVDGLIGPINSFFETVYYAFNKNITFEDNFVSQMIELQFRTGGTYISDNVFPDLTFNRSIPTKTKGIIILSITRDSDNYTPITSGGNTIQWEDRNGLIDIHYISGLEDSKSYKLRLLLI